MELKRWEVPALVKQNVDLAERISRKVEGLKVEGEVAGDIAAALSDIAIASSRLKELLDEFFRTPEADTETLARLATELETEVSHIRFHVTNVRRPLTKLVKRLYDRLGTRR